MLPKKDQEPKNSDVSVEDENVSVADEYVSVADIYVSVADEYVNNVCLSEMPYRKCSLFCQYVDQQVGVDLLERGVAD